MHELLKKRSWSSTRKQSPSFLAPQPLGFGWQEPPVFRGVFGILTGVEELGYPTRLPQRNGDTSGEQAFVRRQSEFRVWFRPFRQRKKPRGVGSGQNSGGFKLARHLGAPNGPY